MNRRWAVRDEAGVVVLAEGLDFPEGPAFDAHGDLWCVEQEGGRLARLSGGKLARFAFGGRPNGLAYDRLGRAWVCDSLRHEIRRLDPDGAWRTVADSLNGKPLNGPNDLAFDSAGNLIFTAPGDFERQPDGQVCCLTRDGAVKLLADGLHFPNGLALADGGKTLVVAETQRGRLWRGGWDAATATWLSPEPWAEVGGETGPDGLELGADGLLYVAVFGSGEVKAVDASGRVARTHALPGKKPTNLAFDPLNRLGLVVSEAEHGQLLSLPGLGPGAGLFG